MLKATSPSAVLLRLVHTTDNAISCIRHLRSQQTRFLASSSGSAARNAPAAGQAYVQLKHDQEEVQNRPGAVSQHPSDREVRASLGGVRPTTKRRPEPISFFTRHEVEESRRVKHHGRPEQSGFNGRAGLKDPRASSRKHLVADAESVKSVSSVQSIDNSSTTMVPFTRPVIDMLSVDELKGLIMDDTSDVNDAWHAYRRLSSFELSSAIGLDNQTELDVDLLFKLFERLVEDRKKTKRQFQDKYLRILAVLNRLRQERGRDDFPYLRTLEWNILIHYSVTGHRGKIPLSAFNKALNVYSDMMADVSEARAAGMHALADMMKPDIYTYNSLIHLAIRTESQSTIDRVQEMLRDTDVRPDRITKLSMINHVFRNEGLHGVTALLRSMKPKEIGADGLCAFMSCAGRCGRIMLVDEVYQTLRQNLEAIRDRDGLVDPASPARSNQVEIEGFSIPRTLVPSEEIFVFAIQTYAYHNHPADAIQVLQDMLSSRRFYPDGPFYQPTREVFRGMFLGFAKHGQRAPASADGPGVAWTWDRLEMLLDALFENHTDLHLTERTLWWIMMGVKKTTADREVSARVWWRLKAHFHIPKRGRLMRLQEKYGDDPVSTGQEAEPSS